MSPRRIAPLVLVALFALVPPAAARGGDDPLVIGHRGAPGTTPSRATRWPSSSAPQSNLKQLNRMTPVRLVQLVDADDVNPDGSLDYTAPFDRPYDWTVSGEPRLLARTFGFFATDAGLREIRTYADGIGPWKRYIVSTAAVDLNGDGTVGDENGDGLVNDADRKALPPTTLIQRAHRTGLKIHTWTFRDEGRFLASDYAGRPVAEYLQFFRLGIDGVFSDFTDTAVFARSLFD